MKREGEVKTMSLPVELKPEEVAVRSRELADNVEEHRQASDRLESLSEGYKGAKKTAEEEIAGILLAVQRLSGVVRNKREYRNVEVSDEIDAKAGKVNTVRLDTGEIVGTRGMTEAERQRSLFKPTAEEPAPASDDAQEPAPKIDKGQADDVRRAAKGSH